MSDYFLNSNIDENERRNVAFQTTLGIRQAISLAQERKTPISYENSLNYVHDLSPKIYDNIVTLLSKRNESDLVKVFQQKAEALSTEELPVDPLDLINVEIESLENLISRRTKNDALKVELAKHRQAAEHFLPRAVSEHKILMHDFTLKDRLKLKEVYRNDQYKDYRIDKDKYLRLRLLHPDKAEEITGADLIYEQFDLTKEKVRFVHLQYKVWKDNLLYFSDKRLISQLEKMQLNLCSGGFCHGSHGKNYSTKQFRFPYCSAFLRPTSNKASVNSKLISSGYHLRVCDVLAKKQTENKLTKDSIKQTSLTQNTFEELFTIGKVGSRWIDIEDLDNFYKNINLPFHSDTIRIHAQQFKE